MQRCAAPKHLRIGLGCYGQGVELCWWSCPVGHLAVCSRPADCKAEARYSGEVQHRRDCSPEGRWYVVIPETTPTPGKTSSEVAAHATHIIGELESLLSAALRHTPEPLATTIRTAIGETTAPSSGKE